MAYPRPPDVTAIPEFPNVIPEADTFPYFSYPCCTLLRHSNAESSSSARNMSDIAMAYTPVISR